MIAAMLNIDNLQQSILVVVIESGNQRRMELGDPITLESTNNGGALTPPRYPQNFNLLIAYESNEKKLYEMAKGPIVDFLRYLESGRKFYPGIDGVVNTHPVERDAAPTRGEAIENDATKG
jgi:hypothetical protein